MTYTHTQPVPEALDPSATMTQAEANALFIQARGIQAELERWQDLHHRNADCRAADAMRGARLLSRALEHLAQAKEYPESTAAHQRLAECFAEEDAAAELMRDEPIPLVPAEDGAPADND